jgi:hypothetical protein
MPFYFLAALVIVFVTVSLPLCVIGDELVKLRKAKDRENSLLERRNEILSKMKQEIHN